MRLANTLENMHRSALVENSFLCSQTLQPIAREPSDWAGIQMKKGEEVNDIPGIDVTDDQGLHSQRVVVLIPRGEVIRNFVYSGALDEVAKRANLTLFSVSTNSDVDASLQERYGAPYPLDAYEERWAVRIQREILDVSHNRWLWSRAAQERSRLRDIEAVTHTQK